MRSGPRRLTQEWAGKLLSTEIASLRIGATAFHFAALERPIALDLSLVDIPTLINEGRLVCLFPLYKWERVAFFHDLLRARADRVRLFRHTALISHKLRAFRAFAVRRRTLFPGELALLSLLLFGGFAAGAILVGLLEFD